MTDLLDKAVGEARDEDAAVVTVDDATDGLRTDLWMERSTTQTCYHAVRPRPIRDRSSFVKVRILQVQVKSGHRRRRVVQPRLPCEL